MKGEDESQGEESEDEDVRVALLSPSLHTLKNDLSNYHNDNQSGFLTWQRVSMFSKY
jgi:hypothetical protein